MADEIHRADDVGRTRPRMSGRHIAALILIGLLVVVAVLNLDDVSVDLIVDSVQVPLIVLIAVSAGVGFLAGWLFFRRRERRRDRRDD
ncbi:MAG TPA: LapA family protein [Acidimicrobiia bacterium]|jgi:uncharacterized integral membrane protein